MPEVADLLTPALVVALFTWLRNDIRKLHDRFDRQDDRFDRLENRIDETDKRIDETNKRIDETNKRIDETNERFDGVSREMGELRECMARLEGALEGFLARFRDREAA